MTKRVLIDAGPLVALHRRDDEHHERCAGVAQKLPPLVYTCWPVITEAAFILRNKPESVQSLLSECANGRFVILPLTAEDVPPIAEILRQYADLEPQLADAALVHLANRESTRTIFSLDRRDFSVFRDKKGQPFELLPE